MGNFLRSNFANLFDGANYYGRNFRWTIYIVGSKLDVKRAHQMILNLMNWMFTTSASIDFFPLNHYGRKKWTFKFATGVYKWHWFMACQECISLKSFRFTVSLKFWNISWLGIINFYSKILSSDYIYYCILKISCCMLLLKYYDFEVHRNNYIDNQNGCDIIKSLNGYKSSNRNPNGKNRRRTEQRASCLKKTVKSFWGILKRLPRYPYAVISCLCVGRGMKPLKSLSTLCIL